MTQILSTITIPFGAGAGKVLTSDGSGNATWQDPPAPAAPGALDGGTPTNPASGLARIDLGGVT